MYLMDARGGGLVTADSTTGPARWAHGVTTTDFQRDIDFLCSLVLEFTRNQGEGVPHQ